MITVRDLDLMSYREKTLHWMTSKPWNPGGARLRFKQPSRSFRAMTEYGCVTRMPLLVGRPCYGILTAFLRYKDAMKPVRGRGMLPASRCAGCILRESCERLVKERIKAHAPLATAYHDWLRLEGPTKFNIPDFETMRVGRAWKRLGHAAAEAQFTSCNDAGVAAYYESLDREVLARDARRKVTAREEARRGGTIDSNHLADLRLAADGRLLEVLEAMNDPKPPRPLRQLPTQSVEDMRDVWLGREVLRAERRKAKARDIARWIVADGRRNDSASFAALCTRVSKDLHRIDMLERLIWKDAPLLKPFSASDEYWSQVWLEREIETPLQNAGSHHRSYPL